VLPYSGFHLTNSIGDADYIRKIRLEWKVIMDYVFPLNKKQGVLNDPDM
jgi:hypothetical protein